MATLRQLLRFGVVGVASNGILYLLYLLFVWFGMGHKLAASIAYVVGVGQSFIWNRSWSFEHRDHMANTLPKYLTAYAVGYFINIAGLYLLVDVAGLGHQWVQAVMIILVAALLFALQKAWIFR